jgi:hypothetical protein
MQKILQYRPRITCFVGLGIADIVKLVPSLVSISKHLVDTDILNQSWQTGKSLNSKIVVGLQPYKMIYPSGSECSSKKVFFLEI